MFNMQAILRSINPPEPAFVCPPPTIALEARLKGLAEHKKAIGMEIARVRKALAQEARAGFKGDTPFMATRSD